MTANPDQAPGSVTPVPPHADCDRAADPGALPKAFEAEIAAAVSYEKGLAIKGVLAILIVVLILALGEFAFR